MLKGIKKITGKWNGNQYYVLKKVGEGGVGSVYKVKDELGNIRALKISTDVNSITREYNILKEFKKLKGIPKVYEIDDFYCEIVGITFYFFVMEYVEGKNLKDVIKNYSLNIKEAMGIGLVLIKILKGIEGRGYTYTDIKLENIIIDIKTHRVMFVDFGGVINSKWGIREYTPTYNMVSWGVGQNYNHIQSTIFGITMLIVSMVFKREFNPLTNNIQDIIHKIKKQSINPYVKKVLIKGLGVKYRSIEVYSNEIRSALISIKDSQLNGVRYFDIVNILLIISISVFLFVIIYSINII